MLTCVKSLRTGALESLVNLGMLSTRKSLPASGELHIRAEDQRNFRPSAAPRFYAFIILGTN